MPQFMGSQITGHNLVTEQQFTKQVIFKIHSFIKNKGMCAVLVTCPCVFLSKNIKVKASTEINRFYTSMSLLYKNCFFFFHQFKLTISKSFG